MQRHQTLDATARHGLIGDCHANPLGPRQVLVVRQEDLDEHELGIWQVRANIAIRGLSFKDLTSGNVLEIGGEARVRVTHECEVCKILRQYVPGETFKKLPGQRGSLGVFVTGGVMTVGDGVVVRTSEYPHVPDGIYDRLAWLVERIPHGQVLTYATLLQLIGAARPYSRVLPTYLRRAAVVGLPAHRVLNSSACLTGHFSDQALRLTAEGVAIDDGGMLVDSARLWDARNVYFAHS